jgi:hypothetical protein
VAKRRIKKTTINQTGIKQVLIPLGILFSAILFIIKIITGGIGWFEVFAPVIIAFFIVFLLSVIKAIIRKM